MSSIWAAGEWVGTYRAADAAVGFRRSTAATVALIVHSHLQTVFEANGFDGEAVVSAAGRAAPRIHADVKWNLWRNGESSVIVNCATSLKITALKLPFPAFLYGPNTQQCRVDLKT